MENEYTHFEQSEVRSDEVPVAGKGSTKKILYLSLGLVLVILAGSLVLFFGKQSTKEQTQVTTEEATSTSLSWTKPEPFVSPEVVIDGAVAEDFSVDEVTNIEAMEKAYGFTFTDEELVKLERDKFVIKNLLDTNITSVPVGDTGREFIALYDEVRGGDVRYRTQANSVFYTTDSVMHIFSLLSLELMKEAENKYLFDSVKEITEELYKQAAGKVQTVTEEEEKGDWTVIRDYFAVPLALLSVAKKAPSEDMYSYSEYIAAKEAFKTEDEGAGTVDKVYAYVDTLDVENSSKEAIKADVKQIYDEVSKSPNVFIFGKDFAQVSGDVILKIPFSLFKPRGSYTSSSQRRQYFRAVQWYQQIPFFLVSNDQTRKAIRIAELVEANQGVFEKYTKFVSLIDMLVGKGDDLEVADYVQARNEFGGDAFDISSFRKKIAEIKPPSRIKGMPAEYSGYDATTVEEVLDLTRGMRFISSKFIPDSYWTGELTQGDETPAVEGYRLPPMPSSLEVMALLGSRSALTALPLFSYYTEFKTAIDIKLAELAEEEQSWGEEFWTGSQANGIMWSIKGMFAWYEVYKEKLPAFMQTSNWGLKSLLTGSAFWTESRHTNILYAKQSFAERGGGPGECENDPLPEAAKGYIEPQPEVYARLLYLADALESIYTSEGYDLYNMHKLGSYKELLNKMIQYSNDELENRQFNEAVATSSYEMYNGDVCEYEVLEETEESEHWEGIRVELAGLMHASLPTSVEGPILPMKDKRAAVVADVHTAYGTTYLEEGTGAPRMIFVAVKDANGPRLTVGFTYSHYEFESNTRLTDEEWQKRLYKDAGEYSVEYLPKNEWPTLPVWYQDLLGTQ